LANVLLQQFDRSQADRQLDLQVGDALLRRGQHLRTDGFWGGTRGLHLFVARRDDVETAATW
jgi:hypothetical protein